MAPRHPRDIADEVETLIDAVGLAPFLIYVMDVCNEKSAHIAENWQDYPLSRRWERAAKMIDKTAEKIEHLGLS